MLTIDFWDIMGQNVRQNMLLVLLVLETIGLLILEDN